MTSHHLDGGFGINWDLSLDKFLTKDEVRKLRSLVRRRREKCVKRVVWFEWFLIELGLNTGLRVFEMADLRCGDVVLRKEFSFVFVRNGKGGRPRQVRVSSEFCQSVMDYLKWKHEHGEGIDFSDALLYSPRARGVYSTRGLQYAFKRCLEKAKIPLYHSIHHARHTYASLLYSSSNNNLRLVQKQLGHSSIVTTQIYANLFNQEMQKAVEKLF